MKTKNYGPKKAQESWTCRQGNCARTCIIFFFTVSRRSSMESDHCHDSSDERSEKDAKKRQKAMRKLMVATGLSFLFMVGEVAGKKVCVYFGTVFCFVFIPNHEKTNKAL